MVAWVFAGQWWPRGSGGVTRPATHSCRMRCQVPDASVGPALPQTYPLPTYTQAWAACLRRACTRLGAPAA